MSSSGFDTGAGTYDKIAHKRGGEGLDIDADTAGELPDPLSMLRFKRRITNLADSFQYILEQAVKMDPAKASMQGLGQETISRAKVSTAAQAEKTCLRQSMAPVKVSMLERKVATVAAAA